MSSSGLHRSSASEVRYDCFTSFPGSQKLSDLGFSWAGPDCTVRDLAREVFERLCGFERKPSVFYDHAEIRGRFRDDLSNAVLQLRGGGCALVLLSGEYLRRKYCLAELRAFLELARLAAVRGRESEAVAVRVVCLASDSSSIRSALQNPHLEAFIGDLGKLQCHPVAHEGTHAMLLKDICDHVLRYWSDNRGMCLGRNQEVCQAYLRRFFTTTPVSLIASALCVTAPEGIPSSFSATFLSLIPSVFGGRAQEGLTREYVFGKAFQQGSLSDQNLLALLQATTDVGAIAALTEFRRKWISDGWPWSIDSSEDLICLARFLDEAARVLREGQDTDEGRAMCSTTSSVSRNLAVDHPANLPSSAKLPNGDVFRPHLPEQQYLGEGLEVSAAISLARLKAAVLPSDFNDGSTATRGSCAPASNSGMRHVALTCLNGEAGVGKTSTCKLLCADEEVRARFSDGAILRIDVGKDATEDKLKDELGSAVLLCGGERSASFIHMSGGVEASVEIARGFFSKRRLLVIVDNVWETPIDSSVVSWTATLSRIASFPGSAVVTTTRFMSLSDCPGFDPVHLGRFDLTSEDSPDWRIAERLFDVLLEASLEEKLSDEFKRSRRKVLAMSCGLALVISTFAGLVRRRQRLGENVESVLSKIEQKVLRLSGKSVGNQLKSKVGHCGLYVAMEESLVHLDTHHDGLNVSSTPLPMRNDGDGKNVRVFRANYDAFAGKPLSARYAALEMMPAASPSAYLSVLCRLWQVPSVADAEEIALLFENAGLGRFEESRQGRLFALHDLQYDYCVDMCDNSVFDTAGVDRTLHDIVNGHALFLSSCESLLGPEIAGAGGCVGWAVFCFCETSALSESLLRQYLSENLFRHLCKAAVGADAGSRRRTSMSVLADSRWLSGRIAENGRSSVVSDLLWYARTTRHITVSSGKGLHLTGKADSTRRAVYDCLMLLADDVRIESGGTLADYLVQISQQHAPNGDADMGDDALYQLVCSSATVGRKTNASSADRADMDDDALNQLVLNTESLGRTTRASRADRVQDRRSMSGSGIIYDLNRRA